MRRDAPDLPRRRSLLASGSCLSVRSYTCALPRRICRDSIINRPDGQLITLEDRPTEGPGKTLENRNFLALLVGHRDGINARAASQRLFPTFRHQPVAF